MKRAKSNKGNKMWDRLSWKPVDTSDASFGEFDQSMFFGLEEIDGNSFILKKSENMFTVEPITDAIAESKSNKNKRKLNPSSDINDSHELTNVNLLATENTVEKIKTKKSKKRKTKIQRLQLRKLKPIEDAFVQKIPNQNEQQQQQSLEEIETFATNETKLQNKTQQQEEEYEQWGNVKLNKLIVDALSKLSFFTPTPIQAMAIPMTLQANCDVVGAAETGSGKTMVFYLLYYLVLDSLQNIIIATKYIFKKEYK
jgi:hypothetical protein